MGKYSHLFWDWNGTLLDDQEHCRACINGLLAARGLPLLADAAAYQAVFGFPIEDYYRRAGFDLAREPFADLAAEYMAAYYRGPFRLQPGAEAVLAEIDRHGYRQLILSASERSYLAEQVAALGVDTYFAELLGIDDIYANGKREIALAYAAREPIEKALLIGDTAHDFAVAEAIGADCLLIAQGHQSRAALAALGPPVLADLPAVLQYL